MNKQVLIQSELSLSEVEVTRWRYNQVAESRLSQAKDKVAEEVPIALVYNGVSHAVMLATPQDLEDFALGFSLSEGVLQNKGDLYDVEIVMQPQGVELHLNIATECFVKLKERRRSLVGRTGCGLCGAESLEQALRLTERPPTKVLDFAKNTNPSINAASSLVVNASSIVAAFHVIQTKQVLQQATGATHACAWVDLSGEVQLLREDVGRHNAMDKLIGALAKTPQSTDGFVLTSSRASVEMVQKVAIAGYNMLAAISAPTGLAIRVAEAYGVTLVGFLRENQFVIYTYAARIKP